MKTKCNFVGIDVSKKDFYACFNEQGEVIRFENNSWGINAFIRQLGKYGYSKNNTIIELESTASYHFPLSCKGTELGYVIKVINPLAVKKQNQTSLRRVKTNEKDGGANQTLFNARSGI